MTVTASNPKKATKTPKHLRVGRKFSTEGVHPYDEVTWERRDIVQTNWKTGESVFEQLGVEFPSTWSENASTIVTTKYFRGAMNTPERETSLKDVIDRVVGRYKAAAVADEYMTAADADIFADELTWLLVNQYFSFNSPVWFNVGTTSPQQVSACFILSVDDSMDSILNWYREEGFIFKGGSGAGLNLSRIRSSKELLKSSGGHASGPVSFMRGADASAGTIKSGGATRRAAKMVVLDVDHPDIEEFVETKAREEDKIRALSAAGFDMDLGGKDIVSVQYQNANNSIRVTDDFMSAVEFGEEFGLRARTTGEVISTVNAADLWQKIARAAWECADPGIQYDDTINDWHTNPETGRITASNPCSEYMSLDNSSCNLASLNLLKFLKDDNTFDITKFVDAVETIITAMDISICFADFPTEPIGKTTRDYRQLGIGYANLGAMLMALGVAYDSPEGRGIAATITALLTGVSYRRSAQLAGIVGPYNGYARNAEAHKRVMRKHTDAATKLADVFDGIAKADFIAPGIVTAQESFNAVAQTAVKEWQTGLAIGEGNGWRNAQASVLAPTGTIGFMMDCDTTGIEPDFSLVKFKKMVGGGSLQIVNNQVPRALAALGYNDDDITAISEHIATTGNVVGAPGLAVEHYAVFDCAAGQERQIEPMGHVRMMAACQPFLSGAISKTCNLPETATVEQIADIYMQGWKLGLKALAVYRDNCKVGQPLSDSHAKDTDETVTEAAEPEVRIVEVPRRERLPRTRSAKVTSFRVGEAEGYMTTGEYVDGRLGEMFLKMSKQGSTLAGVMDAFSVAVSIGLQYGVPLETFVSKFTNQRFEPSGLSDDPDIRMSQSILDYIFRRLALDYLDFDARSAYGIFSTGERTAALNNGGHYEALEPVHQDEVGHEAKDDAPAVVSATVREDIQAQRMKALYEDAPDCTVCGTSIGMRRAGACWIHEPCGTSTGCS